jgi:hypothetical protein
MFKPGDFVAPNENIQFLDNKVYTVEVVSRDADGPKYQEIRLRGEPGWHRASRFTLHVSYIEQADGLVHPDLFGSVDYTISHLGTGKLSDTGNGNASKNDQDKIDLSLIPSIALKEEAKAFMVGERKYNRYNYCKGHKASQLIAAALRHLAAWNEGEENDPIDGQHHLGSARACCAMILRQMELGTLKDDRYRK